MQIKLYGEAALVTSVEVSKIGGGLHVLINTRDRWAGYGRRGSSHDFIKEHITTGPTPDHECIDVVEEKPEHDFGFDEVKCSVVLVPESDEERELLKNQAFDSQDKDQIYYYMVKPELLNHLEVIGSMRKPLSGPKP